MVCFVFRIWRDCIRFDVWNRCRAMIVPLPNQIHLSSTRWSRFPRSRHTAKSFVKIPTYSYERMGWLGCRDLRFSNQDLGIRDENFPKWKSYPDYQDKNFWQNSLNSLSQQSSENGINLPCLYFYFRSMQTFLASREQDWTRLGFLRKLQSSCALVLVFGFSVDRPRWILSYEQTNKFVPVTESARPTKLMIERPLNDKNRWLVSL